MEASTSTYGLKGQILHQQAREIVFNVMQFMKKEEENGAPLIPLNYIKQRVLAATEVSASTYKRIMKEAKLGQQSSFIPPITKRQRKCTKAAVSDGDKGTIRRVIHDFYITAKIRPTLKRILESIKQSGVEFEGGISTLRKVIQSMGFKWHKTTDKRGLLMEPHDIRYKRIVYLNELSRYKAEGRPIVYTDESYIHSTHTVCKEWSDNSNKGLKTPISKGRRLVMVHAGNENGFIPNALIMFTSGASMILTSIIWGTGILRN